MDNEVIMRRLCAADYDEALDFLNLVFSMAKKPHDFQKALPRMWARDDEHMGRHLAMIRDGRIRALVGIYPIPAVVAGRKLMFSTVGNVATHPYETGKGYMTALLNAAMARLDEMDADASRLGGLRQRYARYGYEPIGLQYTFSVTAHNMRSKPLPAEPGDIVFRTIGPNDIDLLNQAASLQRECPMYVERGGPSDFYHTLTAWENLPAAALQGDRMIGYLVANKSGENISECIAKDDETSLHMLFAWLAQKGLPALSVSVAPWQTELLQRLIPLCESWSASSPCRFFIRRWDRVIGALLALKRRLTPLCDGAFTLGIRGWGALRLEVNGEDTDVSKVNEEPAFWLEPATAAHVLAGTVPPYCVCNIPSDLAPLLTDWLPLPLSWCTLDRV